ncbi:F-box protein At4g22390-like isoform X2 [Euphorbia lathyris]|uniref:F-box protein At4g22390-like isoform X2 n=1 Tax=Euphorbia lathyris TaxID=212925 RepID=UPI00331429BC
MDEEEGRNTEQEAMVELPKEIVTEILLRFPVKSLLRFKTACKPWILVWNPSLPTEYKIIPSPRISRYELAAMGYDRSSDDYKIVKVPSGCPIVEDYSSVVIFSLKNNSWSNKIISKRNSVSYYAPWLIYAKNGIHWIATQCYEEDEDIECIMYFDLAEESLDYMNSPSKNLICLVLMNYKESIAILGENFEGQHELWVLENYCGMKSSWNKISSFNFIAPLSSNYSFTLNGEILVYKVKCWFSGYNAGKCWFSKYDAKDGSLKPVVVEDDKITYDAECFYSLFGSPYVESLVSPRQL